MKENMASLNRVKVILHWVYRQDHVSFVVSTVGSRIRLQLPDLSMLHLWLAMHISFIPSTPDPG